MKRSVILLAFFVTTSTAGVAQEYDDLYFNSSDREKIKREKHKEEILEFTGVNNLKRDDTDLNYTTVNSAYQAEHTVDRDQNNVNDNYLKYQSQYNSVNYSSSQRNSDSQGNASDLTYSNNIQEAYDQGYEDGTASSTVINNYYGGDWRGRNVWNNRFYDPFWDSWFYDPWWGWNRGVNISFGWGWNSWRYDPWYRGWGWNRPIVRGWNGIAYCPAPVYTSGVYVAEVNRGRQTVRGSRVSRGGAIVDNGSSGRGSGVSDLTTTQSINARRGRTSGGRGTTIRSDGDGLRRSSGIEGGRAGYVRRGITISSQHQTNRTNTNVGRNSRPAEETVKLGRGGSSETMTGNNSGNAKSYSERSALRNNSTSNGSRNSRYSSRTNSSSVGRGTNSTSRPSRSSSSSVRRSSGSSHSSGSRVGTRSSSSSRSSGSRSSSSSSRKRGN